VLAVSIPARAAYVGVLEGSREGIHDALLHSMMLQALAGPEDAHAMLPITAAEAAAATFSSGAAGGLAALASQVLVVPMDVVSQRQMVASERTGAMRVFRSIVEKEGYRHGLYRGFGLSLLGSLPAGTVWWAVYGGMQHRLDPYRRLRWGETEGSWTYLSRRGAVQVPAGLSAAAVAATLTQPIDVVRTRLQVGNGAGGNGNGASAKPASASAWAVARELYGSSGPRGFFRGTGPRVFHMGLWGVILSSAYEYLKRATRRVDPDGG